MVKVMDAMVRGPRRDGQTSLSMASMQVCMAAGLVHFGGTLFRISRMVEGLSRSARRARVLEVPGSPFFPQGGHANTLRLSFVTVPPERSAEGVAALGRVLSAATVRDQLG